MIRTVSGSFLSSLSSPGGGTMISQNLHAASPLAPPSQHSQRCPNQPRSRLPSLLLGLGLAGSAVARWDHYQTWTQFANTRQTGYLWQRNWYAIITLTQALTGEHDWGLQWQWEPGEAQQQRLPSWQSTHGGGEDREMWNIKTNSNPTSRQETLADSSDGANTSAAPSNTQLYCVSGQSWNKYLQTEKFHESCVQVVKLALYTTIQLVEYQTSKSPFRNTSQAILDSFICSLRKNMIIF